MALIGLIGPRVARNLRSAANVPCNVVTGNACCDTRSRADGAVTAKGTVNGITANTAQRATLKITTFTRRKAGESENSCEFCKVPHRMDSLFFMPVDNRITLKRDALFQPNLKTPISSAELRL
ncbi:hypothetical protein P775_18225 [Puniceibacterium antarcticum]|uniref:Uncharacterized protein n=1 Tax=Puniceibacterium antarcticum TaxID=1206336 RepID=A0A2G8RAP5_9RHOB|nr:hypothetical protein P775_18225 [Puniceibacterium antarcticum]